MSNRMSKFLPLLNRVSKLGNKKSQYAKRNKEFLQGAPIKNNPLGNIHYLSYCNRFFHQIYSFHRGGFTPHTQTNFVTIFDMVLKLQPFELKSSFISEPVTKLRY